MKYALVLALALGACATDTTACDQARQAVILADIALPIACSKPRPECDAAGAALRAAHLAVAALCPSEISRREP
jgi:hypothetical protein